MSDTMYVYVLYSKVATVVSTAPLLLAVEGSCLHLLPSWKESG